MFYINNLLLLLMTSGFIYAQDLQWWQTSTIYQIYPRSFKDSLLADGIGDIRGIILKIPHFVDIGIEAIWLSPVYPSPMKDFGYDISNFTDIDPVFGTMADFEELVLQCRNYGIHVIMDIVPNHSSDEHEWFTKSVAREDPYTDYYTWQDSKGFNATSNERIPPNNWLSVFGGSAWTWNEARQQFYLHQFHQGQPDLNYRNAAVLQEMKDVMNFWLDKGVDGFRLDAVRHLMEDQQFLDEPLSNDTEYTSNEYGYLNHIYTRDLDELYNIIIEFRANLDAKQEELARPLFMMTEAYSDFEDTMKYYGNETHPGAHFPLNFQFIINASNETKAQGLEDIVRLWMDNLPEGAWPNWVIGNHDKSRVASRFGRDFSVPVLIMSQLLPGTSITYNGEEINMEDTWISWEDTQDPQGCQAGPENYQEYSRDPQRTPYQWSSEPNAGFSPPDSVTPWLPINPNYVTLNLEAQKAENISNYHVYKKLLTAKNTYPCLQTASVKTKVINPDVFAFVRELPGPNHSVLVMVNTGDTVQQNVDARSMPGVPDIIEFYTGSLDSKYTETMEIVDATTVEIPPRGGLVFLYMHNSSYIVTSSLVLMLVASVFNFLTQMAMQNVHSE